MMTLLSRFQFVQRLRIVFNEARFVGGASLRNAPWIVVFMLFAALIDLLAVSLIAPFVSLLMGRGVATVLLPNWLLLALGSDPLGTLGIALLVIFALKALATFQLQGTITRLSESIRAHVMTRLLSAYQHRPYRFHLDNSSIELSNRLMWFTQAFASGFIGAGLRLVADSLVFLALGLLIAFASLPALVLLLTVLLGVFLLVLLYTRQRAARLAQSTAHMTAEVMHSVNQAIGGLREVRILGCEAYFLARLTKAGTGLVDATWRLAVLNLVPRHAIELAMIVFLVGLVFFSRISGDAGSAILPLLGLIGAASVRLMPASTSLLSNIAQMRGNRFVVGVLAADLAGSTAAPLKTDVNSAPTNPIQHVQAMDEFHGIQAKKVAFSYSLNRKEVFADLSFEIKAGETVALIGPSGAGKSTLADLLLGFLDPTAGQVLVNGTDLRGNQRAWQSMVAYIPQQSYLIDDTLRRNVALGVADADIDDTRVLRAIEDAQLSALFSQLPGGLDAQLGERGVRFSGGQRQRVSIARALYHDRQFLVFDEATSALDEETEREIVATIRGLAGKKTILLISHRESTLSVAGRSIAIRA
jgi:ATP-binding cassette, subfamily B, bacterial PglK